MKKYLILGLIVITIGIFGARVWYVHSACDKQLSVQNMVEWIENPDDVIYEVNDKTFYVQEAIGSQSIILAYPKLLLANFDMGLEMMSLTENAEIKFEFQKEQDVYVTEMFFDAKQNQLKFYKNKQLLLKKSIAKIEPNVFYNFGWRRLDNALILDIDKSEIFRAEIGNLPLEMMMEIKGNPNNPAAIEIGNVY